MTLLRRALPICLMAPIIGPTWARAAQFQIKVTPAAPTLSDTIHVDVRLMGADGSDLTIDAVDIPSDCVRVQSVSDQGLHQTVTLDPLKPGSCSIPPFRVRCLRVRTESCDVRSAATVIPIHTIVADPDHAEIHDTEAPLVPPEDPKTAPSLAIRLGIAAALIACGVGFMHWQAWRNKPAVRARRHLRRLRHSESGFAELIQILREYLDQRIGLGARFCSSAELIAALESQSLGPGSTEQVLRKFLDACDRSRFGPGATPGAYNDALENCGCLIDCLDFDIARRERAGV